MKPTYIDKHHVDTYDNARNDAGRYGAANSEGGQAAGTKQRVPIMMTRAKV